MQAAGENLLTNAIRKFCSTNQGFLHLTGIEKCVAIRKGTQCRNAIVSATHQCTKWFLNIAKLQYFQIIQQWSIDGTQKSIQRCRLDLKVHSLTPRSNVTIQGSLKVEKY